MHSRNAARLAPLVAVGAVSRQQLVDAGAGRRLLDREMRAGRWTRPFPDVALTAAAPTQLHLARAALLAGGEGAALTGLVACRLHELRDVPEGGPVDLLVPSARRLQVPDGVRLRRTNHPIVAMGRRGLRVVPEGQAVADAALRLPRLQDVRALVLAAAADVRTDLPELLTLLGRAPRRGSGHLRRALVDLGRGAASAPEAEVVDLLLPVARRSRLELLVNADVLLDGRLLGRVDVLLPALGLGVEVDSLRHHGSGPDLEATLRRHERCAAAGLRLLHVTPWSVRVAPHDLVSRVRTAIEEPVLLRPGVSVRPRTLIDGGAERVGAAERTLGLR